jgi:hypothetical protein
VSRIPSGSKMRSFANSLERQAAHLLDDVAQQEEADVGVDEALARARDRGISSTASAIAFSRPTQGIDQSTSGRRPDMCVSRWRMVMSPLP